MENKRVMKLASRGKRFGAYCIDAIVPALNLMLAFVVMGIVMARLGRILGYGNNFGYGWGNGFGNDYGLWNDYGYGYGYGYDGGRSGAATAIIVAIILLLSAVYAAVQMVFFSKSKTMGKAALGLQVISARDGKPIGFWSMLLREWIVKRASAYVLYLGFIWILIDDKNRGWHDKILDTYVVDLKESGELNRSAAEPVAGDIPAQTAEPEPETMPEQKAAPEEPEEISVLPAIDEPTDILPNDGALAEIAEPEADKDAEELTSEE